MKFIKLKHYIFQICIVYLTLLMLCNHCFSQQIQFTPLYLNSNSNRDFSQSSIIDIVQDKYGIIWIADITGVKFFTGQDFHEIVEGNGEILDTQIGRIKKIHANKAGLWVLSDSYLLLVKYDPISFSFNILSYDIECKINQQIYSSPVDTIVYMNDHYSETIFSVNKNVIEKISNINQPLNWDYITLHKERFEDCSVTLDDLVFTTFNDTIYTTRNKNIYSIQGDKFILEYSNLKYSPTIFKKNKGYFVLGNGCFGITIVTESNLESSHYYNSIEGINNSCINSILITKNDKIFVATDGGGISQSLSHIELENVFTTHVNASRIEEQFVWDIEPYSGDSIIAIATQKSGIVLWDLLKDKFVEELLYETPNLTTFSIAKYVPLNLLVSGTNKGLYIQNENSFKKFSDAKTVVVIIRGNFLFTIERNETNTKSFLRKFQVFEKFNSITFLELKSLSFNERLSNLVISKFDDSELYVTGGNSFYSVGNNLENIDTFKIEAPELHEIIEIKEDYYDPNIVWLGTLKNGLLKVNLKDCKVELNLCQTKNEITESIKMIDNTIFSLEVDSLGLWFTTSKGISHLNYHDKLNNYTKKHGLLRTEFNSNASIKLDSSILFGGVGGITKIKTNSDIFDTSNSSNYLVLLRQLNKELEFKESIILFRDTNEIKQIKDLSFNNIEVAFVNLNYLDPYNDNFQFSINSNNHYYLPEVKQFVEIPISVLKSINLGFNKHTLSIRHNHQIIRIIKLVLIGVVLFVAILYFFSLRKKIRSKFKEAILGDADITDKNGLLKFKDVFPGSGLIKFCRGIEYIYATLNESKDSYSLNLINSSTNSVQKLPSISFFEVNKLIDVSYNHSSLNIGSGAKLYKRLFDTRKINPFRLFMRTSLFSPLLLIPLTINGELEKFVLIVPKNYYCRIPLISKKILKDYGEDVKHRILNSRVSNFIISLHRYIGNREIDNIEMIRGVLHQSNKILKADLCIFQRNLIGKSTKIKDLQVDGIRVSNYWDEMKKSPRQRDFLSNYIISKRQNFEFNKNGNKDIQAHKFFVGNKMWQEENIRHVSAFCIKNDAQVFGVVYYAYRTGNTNFAKDGIERRQINSINHQLSLALDFHDVIERKQKFDKYQLKIAGPFIKSAKLLALLHNLNNRFTALEGRLKFFISKAERLYGNANSFLKQEVKNIGTIVENVKRDIVTIEDFWDEKKMKLDKKENDLVSMLDEVLSEANSFKEKRKIKFNKPDFDTSILCDKEQIEHVFLNIIRNAIQATKSGEEITIEIRKLKGALQVSFKDRGSGIQPEILPYIYDPYFSNKDGTGLGLYISSLVIDEHGGRISAKNNKIGTTFTVNLPNKNNP